MNLRPLPALALLDAWEQAANRPTIQRALILLLAAWPEMSLQALAELTIGQRNACLLALREQMFGSQLACQATCPKCEEQLEFTFQVSDIRASPEIEPEIPVTLNAAGYELQFRLPNSLDLMALSKQNSALFARQKLLECCLLGVTFQGQTQSASQLPEEVAAAIVAEMARIDPQADIELTLSCPACAHSWQMTFDIVSYFWEEINNWAYRTLYEVHRLALAYGWRETDILLMSPWKRQFYLKLVNR